MRFGSLRLRRRLHAADTRATDRLAADVARTAGQAPEGLAFVPVFVSSQETYYAGRGAFPYVRIPVISHRRDSNGEIWALCEGRPQNDDWCRQSIIYKTSSDDGDTWSDEAVMWGDGIDIYTNPCLIEDTVTGDKWAFATWADGSITEVEEVELYDNNPPMSERLRAIVRRGGVWYGAGGLPVSLPVTGDQAIDLDYMQAGLGLRRFRAGPAAGITMTDGTLVFAGWSKVFSDLTNDDANFVAFVCRYDRDTGVWSRGESTRVGYGQNEAAVCEISDGKLLMSARLGGGPSFRARNISSDHGATWSLETIDYIADPECHGSVLRLSNDEDWPRIIICNCNDASEREHLTWRLSETDGYPWQVSHRLYTPRTITVSVDWTGAPLIGGPVTYSRASQYTGMVALGPDTWGTLIEDRVKCPDGVGRDRRVISFRRMHLKDMGL